MAIIMRAIEGGADFISFKERYPQLELDRKRKETDLARDSIENPKLDENQIETFLNAMLQLDSSTDEGRGRLINTFLRRVIVFKEYVEIYLSLRKEGSGLELCVSTCNLSFSFASSFKEGACCSCHTHTSNQFQFFI